MGVILHAHPVRGESRIQRKANGGAATLSYYLFIMEFRFDAMLCCTLTRVTKIQKREIILNVHAGRSSPPPP